MFKLKRMFKLILMILDYINDVLYENENADDSPKPSKDDWDSAITFTARTSGTSLLSRDQRFCKQPI